MLKFISAVEDGGVHREYPKQHHWESRTAHILNHLWKDIEKRLPMPDMTDVPFDPIVTVFGVADFAETMPDRLAEDGGAETTGMATRSGFNQEPGKYQNMILIPSIELENGELCEVADTFKSMDIHIFQHEITHCYQNMFDWKNDVEQAKKAGVNIKIKEEFWKFLNGMNDTHTKDYMEHQRVSMKTINEEIDKINDKVKSARANGMSGEEIFKNVIIPNEVALKQKEIKMYCDMISAESEMASIAGKVWTPDFTLEENQMLYHCVFCSIFKRLTLIFEDMSKKKATRQKLEKIGLVPKILQQLNLNNSNLVRIFKEQAHHYIKMKYNYIEKAEAQLDKLAS